MAFIVLVHLRKKHDSPHISTRQANYFGFFPAQSYLNLNSLAHLSNKHDSPYVSICQANYFAPALCFQNSNVLSPETNTTLHTY
jgi:hypothetical protein